MIIEKRGTDKIYQSILFDNVNEFVEVIKSWCIGISETRKESQLYTWRDLRENIIGLINDKHIRFNHNDEGYMISADNVKYTLGKIDLFENGFVYRDKEGFTASEIPFNKVDGFNPLNEDKTSTLTFEVPLASNWDGILEDTEGLYKKAKLFFSIKMCNPSNEKFEKYPQVYFYITDFDVALYK